MARRRTWAVSTAALLAVFVALPNPAVAEDLSVLERISYVAFLADEGSAICASTRLYFSSEDETAFKDAKNYAQWIKQRVSADLSNDDVRSVLVPAAGGAKAETRVAIKLLQSESALFPMVHGDCGTTGTRSGRRLCSESHIN